MVERLRESAVEVGHEVIEAALAAALKRDPNSAPVGIAPEHAVVYQQGLAAAYQHGLEMIPLPELEPDHAETAPTP